MPKRPFANATSRSSAIQRSRTLLAPLDPLQRYEIMEATAYLRISRAELYKQLSDGRLKSIKEGRRRLIPGSEIVRRSTLPAA